MNPAWSRIDVLCARYHARGLQMPPLFNPLRRWRRDGSDFTITTTQRTVKVFLDTHDEGNSPIVTLRPFDMTSEELKQRLTDLLIEHKAVVA